MTESTDGTNTSAARTVPLATVTYMTDAGVAELQATLDRITADPTLWGQTNWASVGGGAGVVDKPTLADVEAGTYQGFALPDAVRDTWRRWLTDDQFSYFSRLPVANCGTTFCVAGDVVTRNGWVFVADQGESVAARIVHEDKLSEYLAWGGAAVADEPDEVAVDLLSLTSNDADKLFALWNTLPTLWAYAYAFSEGRITLPAALPEVTSWRDGVRTNNEPSPAVANPADVRSLILNVMRELWRWDRLTSVHDFVVGVFNAEGYTPDERWAEMRRAAGN